MSPEDMKALVRRYLTEIHHHDNLAVVDEVFHKDFFGHATPPVRGLEALRGVFKGPMDALSDRAVTFNHLLVEGDFITVHVTLAGKHTGEFLGVKPTGKVIRSEAIMIERFQDGQIIEAWPQSNQLQVMQALGYSVTPPE